MDVVKTGAPLRIPLKGSFKGLLMIKIGLWGGHHAILLKPRAVYMFSATSRQFRVQGFGV